MIVNEILGNVNGQPNVAVADTVTFDNESRVKRIQRVTTDAGNEIGIQLDKSVREIEDGDILAHGDEGALVARIAPLDVLVVQPRTIEEALTVAHSLGNRHLQAQFFDASSEFGAEVMVVRYDHTVEHLLEHLEVPFTRGHHVMPKAFRHAEHTH